mgnify:CR=1 FL=1
MLRYPPTRVADTTFLFDPPADTALSTTRPRDMVFESDAPLGPLAPFVAGFWLYHTDGASPVRERSTSAASAWAAAACSLSAFSPPVMRCAQPSSRRRGSTRWAPRSRVATP